MQHVLVAFLLVVAVSAEVNPAYKDHEDFLKMYQCGDPQPRVFEASEVIPEETLQKMKGFTSSIKPHVTVLHRCDNSGCCKPGEKCTASAADDVTLTFLMPIDGSVSWTVVTQTNHTQCACVSAD